MRIRYIFDTILHIIVPNAKRMILLIAILALSNTVCLGIDKYEKEKIFLLAGCSDVQQDNREWDGPSAVENYGSGLLGERNNTNVIWCQKTPNKFLLLFYKDGALTHSQCPATLEYSSHPHGLSLVKRRDKLSDYFLLDDVNKRNSAITFEDKKKIQVRRGPIKTIEHGLIVQDGLSPATLFYCYRRKWYVRVID